MAVPPSPACTVADAARNLIDAADRLRTDYARTLQIVALLEARWAENRAALPPPPPRMMGIARSGARTAGTA